MIAVMPFLADKHTARHTGESRYPANKVRPHAGMIFQKPAQE
jgi:hypothetical protein